MKVGILDTKVSGQQIDDVELYRQKGYEIINSAHLDRGLQFDIVASTWTRINAKRLAKCKIKGVVIKDNDEPGNVVDVELLKNLKIPYGLIGLWGINTRVKWNLEQIRLNSKLQEGNRVVMIADSPSHDALKPQFEIRKMGTLSVTPKEVAETEGQERLKMFLSVADVVIVHLGKDDYKRYWLDEYLPHFKKDALMISTTRGPIYSAVALNKAVMKQRVTAVLDWAWEEDKLIASNKIIHTGHTSYRSEQSGTELAQEVIKSVEKMKRKIK